MVKKLNSPLAPSAVLAKKYNDLMKIDCTFNPNSNPHEYVIWPPQMARDHHNSFN